MEFKTIDNKKFENYEDAEKHAEYLQCGDSTSENGKIYTNGEPADFFTALLDDDK